MSMKTRLSAAVLAFALLGAMISTAPASVSANDSVGGESSSAVELVPGGTGPYRVEDLLPPGSTTAFAKQRGQVYRSIHALLGVGYGWEYNGLFLPRGEYNLDLEFLGKRVGLHSGMEGTWAGVAYTLGERRYLEVSVDITRYLIGDSAVLEANRLSGANRYLTAVAAPRRTSIPVSTPQSSRRAWTPPTR